MARDYKYRAAPKQQKKSAPAWLWMLVGLLLGAFVVGLAWLKMESADNGGPEWIGAKPDRQPQRVEPRKPAVQVPRHEPRFEFFDELRDKEVLVPEDQLDLRASVNNETARYEVQIGSFAKAADAERLRAELALLGVETWLSQVRADGRQYHRVIAGPYLGRSALDKVRKLLKGDGHTGLLVRIVP